MAPGPQAVITSIHDSGFVRLSVIDSRRGMDGWQQGQPSPAASETPADASSVQATSLDRRRDRPTVHKNRCLCNESAPRSFFGAGKIQAAFGV